MNRLDVIHLVIELAVKRAILHQKDGDSHYTVINSYGGERSRQQVRSAVATECNRYNYNAAGKFVDELVGVYIHTVVVTMRALKED